MPQQVVVFEGGRLVPTDLMSLAPVDVEETGPLVKHENLKVECTHMACVEGPDGTRHHVIFNPSAQTVRDIQEWQQSGYARGIDVEDRAGLHCRDVPMVVLKVVSDYGTTIVTTDR